MAIELLVVVGSLFFNLKKNIKWLNNGEETRKKVHIKAKKWKEIKLAALKIDIIETNDIKIRIFFIMKISAQSGTAVGNISQHRSDFGCLNSFIFLYAFVCFKWFEICFFKKMISTGPNQTTAESRKCIMPLEQFSSPAPSYNHSWWKKRINDTRGLGK